MLRELYAVKEAIDWLYRIRGYVAPARLLPA
jgi:hypothetical protein